ncbi:MAG: tRNA (guanosine(46)-N7)-methyltransferase TrmB [Kiritimatiellae bacterium]|nr:tRNA (guanosine(46)-N7)-methyltransferase TrmB [Kiritimatiellia bacterium]
MEPSSAIISLKNWATPLVLDDFFNMDLPLEVDLGCGKGRFIMARATRYPNTNFIGVDRMLMRLRKVNKKIDRAGTSNIRLLRIEASYAMQYLLPPSTVSMFHILFPDPWPKRRHHKNRLFNEKLLDALHSLLKPSGLIHIATDHLEYFEEIIKLFEADSRFSQEPAEEPPEDERTDFEILFTGKGKQTNRAWFRKIQSS